MIPETSENKRLEVYKCISFPNNWELYSTAFEGELIIDCTIFQDKHKKKWMFLNKKTVNSDGCSDLFIYKIDNLKLKNIIPHSKNPVITDSNRGRNAGPVYEEGGQYFRPSQINNNGIYGRGLNINQIIRLNLNDYVEKSIENCYPFFKKDVVGIHHLCQKKNLFVTDLCFREL